MKRKVSNIKYTSYFRERWFHVVFLLALIPLFPEYISFFLVLAAFLLALREASKKKLSKLLAPSGGLMLVYVLYMLLSVFYSAAPWSSLATAAMWLFMMMAFLSLRLVLTDRTRLWVFCLMVTAPVGVCGLIGLIQAFLYHVLGLEITTRLWDFIDLPLYQLFPGQLFLIQTNDRPSATFNNPNIFCEYLSMAMPVALYTLWEESKNPSSLWGFVAGAVISGAAGVLVSLSEGGLLALLASILIFLMARPRRIPWVLAGLFLGALLLSPSVIEKLLALSSASGDVELRLEIWPLAIEAFLQRPVLGWGAGCESVRLFLLDGGLSVPHAHNLVLELAAEGGLIALLLFGLQGFRVARKGAILATHPDSHRLGILFIAFIGAFLVHGLVDFPLLTPKLIAFFLMMLAFFESVCRLYSSREFR